MFNYNFDIFFFGIYVAEDFIIYFDGYGELFNKQRIV